MDSSMIISLEQVLLFFIKLRMRKSRYRRSNSKGSFGSIFLSSVKVVVEVEDDLSEYYFRYCDEMDVILRVFKFMGFGIVFREYKSIEDLYLFMSDSDYIYRSFEFK